MFKASVVVLKCNPMTETLRVLLETQATKKSIEWCSLIGYLGGNRDEQSVLLVLFLRIPNTRTTSFIILKAFVAKKYDAYLRVNITGETNKSVKI